MILRGNAVSDDRIVSKLFGYNDFSRDLCETRSNTHGYHHNQEKYVLLIMQFAYINVLQGYQGPNRPYYDLI